MSVLTDIRNRQPRFMIYASTNKYLRFGIAANENICGIGFWGGQYLSLGDHVRETGLHGRGERSRRALMLAILCNRDGCLRHKEGGSCATGRTSTV